MKAKINVSKYLKLESESDKAYRDYVQAKDHFENVKEKAVANGQTLRPDTIESYENGIASKLEINTKAHEKFDAHEKTIKDALDKVQNNCSERMVTLAGLRGLIPRIDEYLGVPKSYLNGTKVIWSPGNGWNIPKAYKYKYMGTVITLENIKGNWYIVEIDRVDLKSVRHEYQFLMSDLTKGKLLEVMSLPTRLNRFAFA